MNNNLTAAEIRAAKSWLNRRELTTKDISPKKFAKLAKTLDKGFKDTLTLIAISQDKGQA